jgi:glucokinase
MNCAIGLDLGGTNIKGLAVTREGKVLAELVSPTAEPRESSLSRVRENLPHWTENVRQAVQQLRRKAGRNIAWMGVAAPGLPARDQRSIAFMPGRLPGLEGLVWQKFLHVRHAVPVLNDAQAALLGETWHGAARRARNALLLTLGTGVGGAALVDGQLLRGHLGRAGHLGHISLNPDGPLDIVNTPGSLEDLIGDSTVAKRSAGKFDSTLALVSAARGGNAQARRVWLRSIEALAAALASLINVLDPEIIILGGGIAKAGRELLRPLQRFLDKFEWRPGGARVRLVRAQLGERAGAFGAAWNAMHFDPNPHKKD